MNVDEWAAWRAEGVCQVPFRILVDLSGWDTLVKTLFDLEGEVGTSLGFPYIPKWRALPFCHRLQWWDEVALKASRHVRPTVLDCLLQCEYGWTQIPKHPVWDEGRDLGVHVAPSLLMPLSSFKGYQGAGGKDAHPGLILMSYVDMGRECRCGRQKLLEIPKECTSPTI